MIITITWMLQFINIFRISECIKLTDLVYVLEVVEVYLRMKACFCGYQKVTVIKIVGMKWPGNEVK